MQKEIQEKADKDLEAKYNKSVNEYIAQAKKDADAKAILDKKASDAAIEKAAAEKAKTMTKTEVDAYKK